MTLSSALGASAVEWDGSFMDSFQNSMLHKVQRLLQLMIACADINGSGRIDKDDIRRFGQGNSHGWQRVLKDRRDKMLRTGVMPKGYGRDGL